MLLHGCYSYVSEISSFCVLCKTTSQWNVSLLGYGQLIIHAWDIFRDGQSCFDIRGAVYLFYTMLNLSIFDGGC